MLRVGSPHQAKRRRALRARNPTRDSLADGAPMAFQAEARPHSWPGFCFSHHWTPEFMPCKTPPHLQAQRSASASLCIGSLSGEDFPFLASLAGACRTAFTPSCLLRRRLAFVPIPPLAVAHG